MNANQMNWRMLAGTTAVVLFAGAAAAQTPCPAPDNCATNPSFEELNIFSSPPEPTGWHILGASADCKRRTLTDGLLPPAMVRTGEASISLTTPSATDFRGFSSDTTNYTLPELPWYDIAYDWNSQRDIRVSCWYYISAADPLVGNQVAIKLNAKSGLDSPIGNRFQDWATLDPWAGEAPTILPGHTNDEWMYFEETWSFVDLEAEVAANGTAGAGYVPYPEYAPGRIKVVIGRWGPDAGPSSGVVFIDDLKVEFVEPGPTCPPCAADYDGNGGVDGGDLAAFFADFESGETCADVDGNGGVDGGDLGFFFSVFEQGGCE